MHGHKLLPRAACLALTMIAASCGAERDSAETATEPVASYDGLLGALREQGSTVEFVGPMSQPFFAPEGRVLRVDGQEVQVFEFPGEQELEATAETISPDGSSIGTTMISWVAAPHFYKSGRLIVLYVGEEDGVVQVLETVLGPQIAGRNR